VIHGMARQQGHAPLNRIIFYGFADWNCGGAAKMGLQFDQLCFFARRVVSSTLQKGGFALIRKVRGIFLGPVSLLICPPPSSPPTTSRKS